MKLGTMKYDGKEYLIYKSTRKNKQAMVKYGNMNIHFGDPTLKEYPNTKRGDNYCARSFGIKDNKGTKTFNNPKSPNFWSRKFLWDCIGKKSRRR